MTNNEAAHKIAEIMEKWNEDVSNGDPDILAIVRVKAVIDALYAEAQETTHAE